jgi:2,3-bisphosphoglycerate-independent phosphoglycerate mutase
MTRYRQNWEHLPALYPREQHTGILGEVLSRRGVPQLRIAETEKFAHVTFFFNAGTDAEFEGEERILVPSPKVATYDLKPEMSAHEVTERVIEALRSDRFGVIILNFANLDMVGHTGNLDAAVKAAGVVDECAGRVLEEAGNQDWKVLVTSDHGNAEQMIAEDGGRHTYHSTNPVPLVLVSRAHRGAKLREGGLRDIAPTILHLSGLPMPGEMEGRSLIEE